MKIHYDSSMKLAGIGLVPWTRLGLERWFSGYKIASLYDWDVKMHNVPEVVAMNTDGRNVELPKRNSQAMLNNPLFQDLLIRHFKDTNFLTYKSVAVPEELQGHGMKFLASDTVIAKKIENKAYFREHFSSLGLPFPEYAIMTIDDFVATEPRLKAILAGRDEVVVQDAELSGGKGTFFVRDMPSLEYALTSLEQMGSKGTLVISQRVKGAHERSVQCVATRYGVFVGPMQKQLIANPLLTNVTVPDGDKFAGIEISNNDEFAAIYPVLKMHAEAIGKELLTMGYRGIFGIDFLVSDDSEVFVLEVNPRITGATPLLTMLYREGKDIPFYLLHVLEQMNADYEITDTFVDEQAPEGALLMFHAHNTEPAAVVTSPESGLYTEAIQYKKPAIHFEANDQKQVLLQRYIPPQFSVKPGGRTLCAFFNFPVLRPGDTLSKEATMAIEKINDMITLESV